jgi:hypothetical protein
LYSNIGMSNIMQKSKRARLRIKMLEGERRDFVLWWKGSCRRSEPQQAPYSRRKDPNDDAIAQSRSDHKKEVDQGKQKMIVEWHSFKLLPVRVKKAQVFRWQIPAQQLHLLVVLERTGDWSRFVQIHFLVVFFTCFQRFPLFWLSSMSASFCDFKVLLTSQKSKLF